MEPLTESVTLAVVPVASITVVADVLAVSVPVVPGAMNVCDVGGGFAMTVLGSVNVAGMLDGVAPVEVRLISMLPPTVSPAVSERML